MAESKFSAPKPVSEGDVVEVKIDAVGGRGDGIGKVDDFVVFVKGASAGETVKAKIVEVKRTFAIAEKV